MRKVTSISILRNTRKPKHVTIKNIKRIKLDFVYNLSQEKMNFDNVKIDNQSNVKVDNFINDFIFLNNGYFNKVTFRNFVKKFFNIYDG